MKTKTKFPFVLKVIGFGWLIILLLAILFKIKMFIELLPVIGTIFVIGFLIFTVKILLNNKE